MEWFASIVDIFLHLDKHMAAVLDQYAGWTYGILFAIIFAETGLVITPFLPGDSLLFAAGIFSHPGQPGNLNVWLLMFLLIVAAILGDGVNYHIGQAFGNKLFKNDNSRIFKKSHLAKTHAFFEKYGAKTIILARFVPIVRTFAPFVAGMGSMTYRKFLTYNVVGAHIWVIGCVGAGYLFGGIPVVRQNFTYVILAIVLLSVMPMIIEIVLHRREAKRIAREMAAQESA
jgi:membrane-associated protein